jgi:hypothetical protein
MNPETGKFHRVDDRGHLMEDVAEAGLLAGDPVPSTWVPFDFGEEVEVRKADGTKVRMRVWKVDGRKITFRPVPGGAS